MSDKLEVNFEVYIKHGQEGEWELHSRYPAAKKDLAMNDAKSLEHISTISAVKIVREAYDPVKGVGAESNIYDSSKPAPAAPPVHKPAPVKAKPTPAKPGSAKKAHADKAKNKKPAAENKGKSQKRPQVSFMSIVIKLLLITMISLIIAGIFMAMGGIWLRDTSFAKNTQSNILFGVFVVTFLVSGLSIAKTVLTRQPLGAAPERPDFAPEPKPKQKNQPLPHTPPDEDRNNDQAKK